MFVSMETNSSNFCMISTKIVENQQEIIASNIDKFYKLFAINYADIGY